MSLNLLKKTTELRYKQKIILDLVSKTNIKYINLKVHNELSPLGWHVIHCAFIEVVWIRSKYLNDFYYENKLKSIADANKVSISARSKGLPSAQEILNFTKKLFTENILILEDLIKKKNKKIDTKELNYLINFLMHHHGQHIENIKNILNLFNIKFNKNALNFSCEIDPLNYKFKGLDVKEGVYNIGASEKTFCYDNEIPQHKVTLKGFSISHNLITISEWLGFIFYGGYDKKSFWSLEGWDWKIKNKISLPLNWVFTDKKRFAISTYKGYERPLKNMPVSNISKFELEAFANYSKCRIPHEYEWEASFSLIKNKYKVWEWSTNLFFGYKGFKAFPYKEYSVPWFNNNYYVLRGASVYSSKEIKRSSFRNFYMPKVRYILSGGRLCI